MRVRLSVVLAVLALGAAGCGPAQQSPSQAPGATTVHSSPAVTLGERPVLPADFVDRIDGATATIPLAAAALQLLRGTDAGLGHNTTDNAYNNLIAGTKDIIFAPEPSPEQLAAAEAANVGLSVNYLAKDALVFLANPANPTPGLTRQQVIDVYTGKVTDWEQVGGPSADILPYQHPVNSGPQSLFLQLAMGGARPMAPPEERVLDSMGNLAEAVSQYDNAVNALGYSTYYAQQTYARDNVKLLDIDGVQPTAQTIAAATYPYQTYHCAVIRADEPAGSLARQLIGWLGSTEGQQMAASIGYVPLLSSNIVPVTPQYGYHGSTAENTTESSGAGGPVGWRPDAADPCAGTGCLRGDPSQGGPASVTIPGFPDAEMAAQIWADGLPEPPTYSDCRSGACHRAEPLWRVVTWQDLVAVTRDLRWPTTPSNTLARDSAVFRLSDGARIALSDLFYDGVNYIDFINRHLLDTAANHAWSACQASQLPDCQVETATPFTGLPLDYDSFTIDNGRLSFTFPADNPFLSAFDQGAGQPVSVIVPFNLPADLSPYGLCWRLDRVKVGAVQVDHIVRDSTGPTPVDDLVNQGIDALAAQNPTLPMLATAITGNVVVVSSATSPLEARFDYATGQRLNRA